MTEEDHFDAWENELDDGIAVEYNTWGEQLMIVTVYFLGSVVTIATGVLLVWLALKLM